MKARIGALAFAALLVSSPASRPQTEGAPSILEQALAELEAGRLEAAIALLEPRRQKSEADPQALALLGALYVETERPDAALEVLQPLAEGQRPDPAVLYNAGRAALALGRRDLAEGYLERSVSLSPGSPAERELGLLRGQKGQYRQAYALLVPWARTHPDDVQARLAGALCAVQLERLPTAEELLSDLPQDNPRVRFLWGRVLILKGDPWGAIATLKPLLDDAPSHMDLDVRQALAEAYTMAGKSSSAVELLEGLADGRPDVALQLTHAQYQSGDLRAALATIEPVAQSVLASDQPPSETEAASGIVLIYGRLLSADGRHQEALPALQLATRLAPEEKQGWKALGQALAALGRTEEAQEALARFRDLAEGESRPSLSQREEDLKDPTGREVRRGLELIAAGEAEKALKVARQETALAPTDPRPRLLEGTALLHLQRPEEALDTAQRLLAMEPDNADAVYLRGTVRMALHDLAGAEADLRRVLELAPEHTAAMNDLAVLLMSQDGEEEARRLLQRVLELRPDDPVARDNLDRLEKQ